MIKFLQVYDVGSWFQVVALGLLGKLLFLQSCYGLSRSMLQVCLRHIFWSVAGFMCWSGCIADPCYGVGCKHGLGRVIFLVGLFAAVGVMMWWSDIRGIAWC